MEAGLAELRRLFAAECTLGTSAPGFGVSPPVRSGAANGLVHDSLWRQASSWGQQTFREAGCMQRHSRLG